MLCHAVVGPQPNQALAGFNALEIGSVCCSYDGVFIRVRDRHAQDLSVNCNRMIGRVQLSMFMASVSGTG